jgi:hypothetical protein
MKKFLLLILMPVFLNAHKATLINGSDVSIYFALHTSLLGCCCSSPVWSCAKDGGPGQCDERDVKPNTTRVHDLTGACSGACWTGVEVWGPKGKIGYADFTPGACEDIWVMVYGKNGDYHVDKRGGGDVGHIIQKGFQDFGQAIQIDKIAKTPEILQKGFEIIGLGTEIAGLEIKLGSLQASQAAASGFLDGMKKMTGGLLHGLPEIVKALQVRKIEFEGSMRDLAKGSFPKGTFEFVIAGKTVSLTDIQMDPRKPADAIVKLVDKGVDEVKKAFDQVIRFSDQINNVFVATKKPQKADAVVAVPFVPRPELLAPIKYGDQICLRDWQGKYFDASGYDSGCAVGWTLVKLDPKSPVQKPTIIPSQEQVKYGDMVALRSNNKYIKTQNDSERHIDYAPQIGEWERWVIMNPDPQLSKGGVMGGDMMQFKNVSFKGMFHSETGSAKGNINGNGSDTDVGSMWIIHPKVAPVKGEDAGQGYIWNNPPSYQVKCGEGATLNAEKSGCRCLLPKEPGYKGNTLKKGSDNQQAPSGVTRDYWVCN